MTHRAMQSACEICVAICGAVGGLTPPRGFATLDALGAAVAVVVLALYAHPL